MSIYIENPDGSLECIREDYTMSGIVEIINEARVEAGLEIDPCMVNTFNSVELSNG
jgi:hypothetical protein